MNVHRNKVSRLCISVAGLLGGILGGLMIVASATAQDGPALEAEERGLRQLIAETREAMSASKWLEAAEKFDAAWKASCEAGDPLMLSAGADVRQLMPGQTEEMPGGKAQLERLFVDAPNEFRREFRNQYLEVAESQIFDAINSGDLPELRTRCLRYSFLPAAKTGYEMLARVSIDRGDFQEAALLLGRLERMAALDNTPVSTERLALLAVCFARAGLAEDARDTLKRIPPGAAAGDFQRPDVSSEEELSQWLQRQSADTAESVADPSSLFWTQPGGNYRRSRLQNRTPPALQSAWTSPLFAVNDVMYAEQYNPLLVEIGRDLESELLRMLPENRTLIPTPQPLIHGDMVIVRTPFGIRAIRQKSGELIWEVTRPDNVVRSMLDRRASGAGVVDEDSVLSYMISMEPWRLFFSNMIRTNTSSQMSISGRTLFVIDDCYEATSGDGAQFAFGAAENLVIPSNLIRAYDVKTGLFLWEIGGKTQVNAVPAGKGNLLSGFYFLGAPLVLGERTYVLAESGEGLFLIQIAAPSLTAGPRNPSIARAQILTVPRVKLPDHPVRSHAGLMPSFAQGLLICPTCDERIVAVSAEDHSLRWVFRYSANIRTQELGGDANVLFGGRDFFDSARVDLDSRWIDSLPRVVNDRILVSPRDSDQLYCLDLASGRELWKAARSGFHGIAAVTNEAVVLVGNEQVASFRLDTGDQMWSRAITDGIVVGTTSSNGRLLQVPVSDPAVLTFDLTTGNLLVRQPLPTFSPAGNLLTTSDGTLMQSVTSVSFFPAISNPTTLADRVTDQLLNGQLSDAIELLEKESEKQPITSDLRNLIVEVMLRAMQSDFPRYRSLLPRVRMLANASDEDLDVPSLVHSLIGMSLPDVGASARLLQGNGRRFQDMMLELEAREIRESGSLTIDELTEAVSYQIQRLPDGRSEQASFGLLHRCRASVIVASIRHALMSRSASDRQELAVRLQQVAQEAIAGLASEQEQVQFVSDLINCGLYETVLPLVSDQTTELLKPRAEMLREQIRLQMISEGIDVSSNADSILQKWLTTGQIDAAESFVRDVAVDPVAASSLRFQIADAAARKDVLAKWQDQVPDLHARSVWTEVPVVVESDDRTMLPTSPQPSTVPNQNIPLYGPPGVFRDWSFVRNFSAQGAGGEQIMAFDSDGHLRWKLQLSSMPLMAQPKFSARAWFVASGHLLILCEGEMITAIDAFQVSPDQQPKVIWNDFPSSRLSNEDMANYQSFVPPAERVLQYFPTPSGFFPMGLIRLGTIPILSGRRLTMLSSLSGMELWHLDGLSPDTVLLGHGDSVLLLSEQARQVEVRSVLDGPQVNLQRLPEWWGDAIANVGSSVRTIELEAGTESIWRVVMYGQSCVRFSLTDGASKLESRDIVTDQVQWEIGLPEDAVFSNPIDDVIAVLAEGRRLMLIQIDSGKILADLEVTPSQNAFDLVLRKSHGEFIILPGADPDPSDYPINYATYVAGRMYAVNAGTFRLSWDCELEPRHIRTMVPERATMIPNAPVLVLLSRGSVGEMTSGLRKVRYGVQVVDVHTGEDLFSSHDIGVTLNEHWMHVDTEKKRITISFERRFVTLDYSGKE
ncbi:MAG: PQQ-binding-like beta-propeller repeat protein [Planctomycetota bacterium]